MKMMVSTAATGTVKSTWCSLSELMQKVGVVRSILPSTTPLTEQTSNIDYLSIFIYKLTCIRIRRKGIIKVEAAIVRLDCQIQAGILLTRIRQLLTAHGSRRPRSLSTPRSHCPSPTRASAGTGAPPPAASRHRV